MPIQSAPEETGEEDAESSEAGLLGHVSEAGGGAEGDLLNQRLVPFLGR